MPHRPTRPAPSLTRLLVLAGLLPLAIACAGLAPQAPGSLEAENERLARALFDALSRADRAAVDALYAPDFRVWTAGSFPLSGDHSREEALQGLDAVLTMFPDGIRFDIKAVTAQGERVALEAESYGVHVNGRVYNNLYHFLVIVRDGQIHRLKEYMDTALADEVLFGSTDAGNRSAAGN